MWIWYPSENKLAELGGIKHRNCPSKRVHLSKTSFKTAIASFRFKISLSISFAFKVEMMEEPMHDWNGENPHSNQQNHPAI